MVQILIKLSLFLEADLSVGVVIGESAVRFSGILNYESKKDIGVCKG